MYGVDGSLIDTAEKQMQRVMEARDIGRSDVNRSSNNGRAGARKCSIAASYVVSGGIRPIELAFDARITKNSMQLLRYRFLDSLVARTERDKLDTRSHKKLFR